jgi:hypothetical protein
MGRDDRLIEEARLCRDRLLDAGLPMAEGLILPRLRLGLDDDGGAACQGSF